MDTKQQRTTRLREIMRAHKLKAADVGRILHREPQTVRSWCCGYELRAIPAELLRLLELEVGKCPAENATAKTPRA